MGLCGSSSAQIESKPEMATKVAPRKVGDGRASVIHEQRKLQRSSSGSDLSLKEALCNVFQFSIVNKYGPIKKRKSREEIFLEKINYLKVIQGEVSHLPGLPPRDSEEFKAQANAMFDQIDTNKDGNMSLDEFIQWYMNK